MMERAVEELADKIVDRYKKLADNERLIIGVAGVPGAGKSTLAYPLTELINEKLGLFASAHQPHIDVTKGLADPILDQATRIAVSVSLDGWHSTRAALDKLPDPAEARRRRGAAFTFDAEDYVQFVKNLKASPLLPNIPFRTFSHAKKDPEPGPFAITPFHRVIVIEGLYTLLSAKPWDQATNLLDERIWIECPDEVAKPRLIARHVATGVEPDYKSATKRVEGSCMHNAKYIRDHLATPTASIESTLDEKFAAIIEAKLSGKA